jgi:hypothetical protein
MYGTGIAPGIFDKVGAAAVPNLIPVSIAIRAAVPSNIPFSAPEK